jgi:tape measure domain-containing protein
VSDELRLIVTAAVKDAVRDLKTADKTFDSTAKRMKAQIADLNKIGSTLSRYVTAPIMGAAIASVKFAADLEKQQVAFETLLGSAAKGAEIFERLKKFSAETPLQLEDITKGAQTLLAFGTSADVVVNRLQMLGDAAMGDGGKLDALVNAYGKLQAKGVASLEEINRFTENGVPLLDALAKHLGVTTQEVLRFVSTGKVKFKDVQAALQDLTTGGGQFAGMMEKMSQTTAGKFSSAMDNMKLSAAKLGESLLPLANKLIDGVSRMAEKFGAMDESAQKTVLILGGAAALAGPILKTAGSVATLALNLSKVPWAQVGGFLARLGPAGLAIAGVGLVTVGIAAAIDKAYTRKINEDAGFRRGEIAETLALADRTLEVYKRIADSYGESLDVVIQIAKENGIVTDEIERQAKAFKDQEQYYQARIEAAKTGPVSTVTTGGGALERPWQDWFQEVAGISAETGSEAGRLFVRALGAQLELDRSITESLGQKFDMTAALEAQQEQIHTILTQLFAIDPAQIDLPFGLLDDSVAALIGRYQELEREKQLYIERTNGEAAADDSLLSRRARLDELLDQEQARVQETTEAWSVYAQVQDLLSDPTTSADQIALLAGIKAELEEQLGITGLITEEKERQKKIAEEQIAKEKELKEIWTDLGRSAARTMTDQLLPFAHAIGESIGKAESASEAIRGIGDAAVEAAGSILSRVAPLLLEAGLKLIVAGAIPPGLALVAASGIVALAGGLIASTGIGHITENNTTDYASMIISEEERLAEERVRILQETIERERQIRDDAMADLETQFGREFDVIRDAWQRNLISTQEFIAQTQGLNQQFEQEQATVEAPFDAAQAAIDAEEAQRQAVEDARQTALSNLAAQAVTIQASLNAMSDYQRFTSGRDERYQSYLDTINAATEAIRNAQSIAAIDAAYASAAAVFPRSGPGMQQAAAAGADFVTSGPRLLMVGDNPGGRERVSVTPIGSPNRFGPSSGPALHFHGNIYGVEHLTEEISRIWERLERRRRIPA